MIKKNTSDCLIIGGGIIGLMTAKYLVQAGISTTVLDAGFYGKESSWAGAGILSPLYPWQYNKQVNQLSQDSQAIYADFAQTISQNTGIDVGYRSSGLLIVDNYQHPQAQQWLQEFNVPYYISDKGLLLPKVAQIRNPNLLKALFTDLIKQGVVILEQQQVSNLIHTSSVVTGAMVGRQAYYAKHTIICGGAWSGKLLKTLLKPELLMDDIYPMRGQILLLELPKYINLDELMPHIVLVENKYFVPREGNLLLIGSTFEAVGFNKDTTKKMQKELYQFGLKYYPILSQATLLKQWSGLRPATHSGNIHISKSQHYSGLYFNAGHFGNGINTALASANLLRGLVLSNN